VVWPWGGAAEHGTCWYLDVIKHDNPGDAEACCTEMFKTGWLIILNYLELWGHQQTAVDQIVLADEVFVTGFCNCNRIFPLCVYADYTVCKPYDSRVHRLYNCTENVMLLAILLKSFSVTYA